MKGKVNTMKKLMFAMAAAATACVLSGCATTHARETQLDLAPKTAALEPQDVRRTVEKMVDSMLNDSDFKDDLRKAFGEERPVIDLAEVKNNSSMHIDTKMVTSSIRTKLIRSRKFRFMDHTTAANDQRFLNDQALNGMTDPSKAVRMGKQSAQQLYLYGALDEIRNQTDDVTDRYYKFNLNLKDIKSGEIVWTDEQEVRKEQVKALIGF